MGSTIFAYAYRARELHKSRTSSFFCWRRVAPTVGSERTLFHMASRTHSILSRDRRMRVASRQIRVRASQRAPLARYVYPYTGMAIPRGIGSCRIIRRSGPFASNRQTECERVKSAPGMATDSCESCWVSSPPRHTRRRRQLTGYIMCLPGVHWIFSTCAHVDLRTE
jgi:hypothetical protein